MGHASLLTFAQAVMSDMCACMTYAALDTNCKMAHGVQPAFANMTS